MSLSRSFVVCVTAVTLLAGSSAEAARKRPVRPGALNPTGQCHTFGFVRTGLKATYRAVAPSGTANFTITYLSDTATQTRTTQHVVTPQATTDTATTIDAEQVGTLRALKRIFTRTTVTVPISFTTDTTIDFVPSLAAGPAAGWCVGAKWNVSPSTQTITTSTPVGPQITTTTTAASVGEVLAVGDTIAVPAGSFKTVKYRGAIVSGTSVSPAITWVSMPDAIVVRQDTLDASGNVTSTLTLQSLQ